MIYTFTLDIILRMGDIKYNKAENIRINKLTLFFIERLLINMKTYSKGTKNIQKNDDLGVQNFNNALKFIFLKKDKNAVPLLLQIEVYRSKKRVPMQFLSNWPTDFGKKDLNF